MTEIDLIVNQFILEDGKLYTLPELYHQLEEKIRSNTASIEEIGEIISTDAILSAKILKIANSPLYGFRSEVSTLNRALNLIGLAEVKNLILFDALAGQFNESPPCKYIKLEDFWRRSVYIALISKRLSIKLKHPDSERLFISAIMSRLGQLVCCSTHSNEVSEIFKEHLNSPDKSEFEVEQNLLGFTYNEVSAKILEYWKVPDEIVKPLSFFQNPLNAPEVIKKTYLADILILNVATIYSRILERDELSSNTGELIIETAETYLSNIDPVINEALGIDTKTVEDILLEIEMDSLEILGIIFPNSSLIF